MLMSITIEAWTANAVLEHRASAMSLRPPSVASAHHPALSDALILQKPPPPTQKMATVSASVRAMLRLLFSKQMVQLWPLSMYLAASVAMWGPIFVSTLLPSMFFLQH